MIAKQSRQGKAETEMMAKQSRQGKAETEMIAKQSRQGKAKTEVLPKSKMSGAKKENQVKLRGVVWPVIFLLPFASDACLGFSCDGPASALAISLSAAANCLNYVVCFRGLHSVELSCPPQTAFDPMKLTCTKDALDLCQQALDRLQLMRQISCSPDAPDQFYPDYSRNCPDVVFFLCRNGILSYNECTGGLIFDEGTDSCVVPSNKPCGVAGLSCPPGIGRLSIYANYPEGCPTTRFFFCADNGSMVQFICPQGLFYNGAIKNCDYRDNILCGTNVPYPVSVRIKFSSQ